MSEYDVAIVGATGAVGEVMLEILEERKFPVRNLYLVASERSAGSRLQFAGKSIVVQDLAKFDFSQVQIGLFSAGGSVSEIYAPKAAEQGCVVIDNTSFFRQEDDIPLVVPEVNPERIADYKNRGIIANPNCSTIQMVVALKPIYDAAGIKKLNISTYQAVSGGGKSAIESLATQTAKLLNAQPIEHTVYPQQIAFNVLPYCGDFEENGYTSEEMKLVRETRKIFEDQEIEVNPTCVRVPVFFGHSESVHIETKKPLSAENATRLLAGAAGVEVIDERDNPDFPTAVRDAAGSDPVFVGRIRDDMALETGLNLWIVSDNVRKGAALNSIQIAEVLIKHLQ
jgi:aspartate-semialdehyde dehydrogenase